MRRSPSPAPQTQQYYTNLHSQDAACRQLSAHPAHSTWSKEDRIVKPFNGPNLYHGNAGSRSTPHRVDSQFRDHELESDSLWPTTAFETKHSVNPGYSDACRESTHSSKHDKAQFYHMSHASKSVGSFGEFGKISSQPESNFKRSSFPMASQLIADGGYGDMKALDSCIEWNCTSEGTKTTLRPRSKSFAGSSNAQYTLDGMEIIFYVKALYDYQATIPEEIGFCHGDTLAVLRMQPDGW